MSSTVPVTDLLARFVADLRWADIPADVRERLPVLLVDVFRAGLVGYDQPWTRAVLRTFEPHAAIRESQVLFRDVQLDMAHAAYVNGVACGSLDWDDSHVAAIIHPGVVVWPAALAAAQHCRASGRELLEAVLAGYEIAIRIGMSIQPEHSLRGFQGTPTCGTFGAAAAVAKLLRMDAAGVRNALGIAATFASGLSQFFISGSDIKRLHAGRAAANGVQAALLAHSGLTGPRDAIEGAQGFARATSDRFDPATAVAALGVEFQTQAISLKPHAGSVRMQAAIEAAGQLALNGVRAEEIVRIDIGVHPAMMGKLTGNEPGDAQAAQVSTPFAVAMAFRLASARGPHFVLTIDDYTAAVRDEATRALARRVMCEADPLVQRATSPTAVASRVRVTLADGSTREHFVTAPRGSPQRPMKTEEICARFSAMARGKVAEAAAQSWLAAARDVERLPDVMPLLALRASQR